MECRTSKRSVFIIGAGMAGLSAARRLADEGDNFDVTVIEANPHRYGGRIYSFEVPGETGKPVDLGAMWIHSGTNPDHPLTKLCNKYGIDTKPHDVLHPGYMLPFDDHGRALSPSQALGAMCRLNQLLEDKKEKRRMSSAPDTSLQALCAELQTENEQFMSQDYVKFMALTGVVSYNGAVAEDLSAKFVDGVPGSEQHYMEGTDTIIPAGYKTLLDRMISTGRQFPVILDRKVEKISIESTADKVRIVSRDKRNQRYEYVADHVVIAIPLGVLKARSIHFDPSLSPNHLAAIDRIGFGNQVKVLLVFDGEPFWPDVETLVTVSTATVGWPLMFTNMRKINGLNGLLAKLAGYAANIADTMDENAVVKRVLDKLETIVGADKLAKHRLVYSKVTTWRNDPFFRGTYSFGKVGMKTEDAYAIRRPISHHIFFAGEHTQFPEGEIGTVYGAYMSGHRVAEEIMACIRQKGSHLNARL